MLHGQNDHVLLEFARRNGSKRRENERQQQRIQRDQRRAPRWDGHRQNKR